jgi:acetylornithine/succinyldiaminopimelate/putrescine aminotransferase
MVDEIQSCIWSADIFMFREYGLQPDFVSIGKGFPGGQYAASRILGTAQYDTMQQFGALVTNGQEELASLAYLITLAFAESNREYVAELGDYYAQFLDHLASEFADVIETVEGWRHLSALRFYNVDLAVRFTKAMNTAGYDVSAQTYKASCPPTILTKIPLIASYAMVDQFVGQMARSLASLRS